MRGEHADAHSVPGVQVFNTLIDRVAQDDEYLRRTLAPAARYDDFTVCHCLCRSHQMCFPMRYLERLHSAQYSMGRRWCFVFCLG